MIISFPKHSSNLDNGVLGFCTIALLSAPMKHCHYNIKYSKILPLWILYSSKDSNLPGRGSVLRHVALLPQPYLTSGTKFFHLLQVSLIMEMLFIYNYLSNKFTEYSSGETPSILYNRRAKIPCWNSSDRLLNWEKEQQKYGKSYALNAMVVLLLPIQWKIDDLISTGGINV